MKKKHIGIKSITKMIEVKETDILYDQIKMFLGAFYIELTDDEIERVYQQAKRLNKDGMFMSQVIMAFKQRLDDKTLEPVEDKVSYLCGMIKQGNVIPSREIKNKFNNFQQNDYDYAELEKRLLDN